jgi:deoxyribodipyrimidine photo-lyase
LITDQDCRVEDFGLAGFDIRTVATLSASHLHSPLPVANMVVGFEADGLANAAVRVGASPVLLQAADPAALGKRAADVGVKQIATPYITRGPLRDWLDDAAPSLASQGISLCDWQPAI